MCEYLAKILLYFDTYDGVEVDELGLKIAVKFHPLHLSSQLSRTCSFHTHVNETTQLPVCLRLNLDGNFEDIDYI